MNIDQLKTIFELIQSLLWASIVGAIVFLFSKPLRQILETTHEIIKLRGLKVTSTGVEIPSPQEEVEAKLDTHTQSSHFEELLKKQNQISLLDLPLIDQEESALTSENKVRSVLAQEITESLKIFFEEKKKSQPDLSKEGICNKLLADAYVNLYFERCFQYLFGSQLHFLSHLMHQTENKSERTNAFAIYEGAMHDTTVIYFEKWIENLGRLRFVRLQGEVIFLSDAGKEFLHYITTQSYSMKKAG